jgi:thioredoxin-related protein
MLFSLCAATRRAGFVALAAATIVVSAPAQEDPSKQTGQPADTVWFADFDEGAKAAKAGNKDLLVDFTGSDWCVWCKRLDDEVFSKPEFLDAAKKRFVLVKLDFPKGEEAKKIVPNPERNAQLRDQYEVGGYPTILLLDSSAEILGSTGYQPGGPVKYVEHLDDVLADGKKLRAALDGYAKAADGEPKAAAWDAIAASYEELDASSVLLAKATPPIREALTFDADNAKGRKLRALKALYGKLKMEPADEDVARALDPKNEKGLLELVVKVELMQVQDEDSARKALEQFDALGAAKDPKLGYELNAIAAYYAMMLKDMPRAKGYAQKAKDIGGDDPRLGQIIEQILGS